MVNKQVRPFCKKQDLIFLCFPTGKIERGMSQERTKLQVKFKFRNCDVCGNKDSTELIKLYGTAYHQCTSCSSIYANPVADNIVEICQENYRNSIDGYITKIQDKRKQNYKKLKRFSNFRKTGNLLEIGCNAGAFISVARDMGWNVKGVDISVTASSYAREKMGLDVYTGTVENAAYPAEYFDVIYTNAVLEHLRYPLSVLQECRRILRPDGVFYASTVNWDSYTRQMLGSGWKLIDPITHIHLFTPDNIITLCKYAGLEHIKTWSTGVRSQANAPNSTVMIPRYLHFSKSIFSALTRFTKKGDSIKFLARKKLEEFSRIPDDI